MELAFECNVCRMMLARVTQGMEHVSLSKSCKISKRKIPTIYNSIIFYREECNVKGCLHLFI